MYYISTNYFKEFTNDCLDALTPLLSKFGQTTLVKQGFKFVGSGFSGYILLTKTFDKTKNMANSAVSATTFSHMELDKAQLSIVSKWNDKAVSLYEAGKEDEAYSIYALIRHFWKVPTKPKEPGLIEKIAGVTFAGLAAMIPGVGVVAGPAVGLAMAAGLQSGDANAPRFAIGKLAKYGQEQLLTKHNSISFPDGAVYKLQANGKATKSKSGQSMKKDKNLTIDVIPPNMLALPANGVFVMGGKPLEKSSGMSLTTMLIIGAIVLFILK